MSVFDEWSDKCSHCGNYVKYWNEAYHASKECLEQSNKVKILFLDIDGVLNNVNYAMEMAEYRKLHHLPHDGRLPFDPKSVAALNEITEATDPIIVLSSTWRFQGIEKVQEMFDKIGVKCKISHKTPLISNAPRGWEIERWLSDNKYDCKGNVNYAIIDDDSDMMIYQGAHFVKTDNRIGLQKNHVGKTIKILNR